MSFKASSEICARIIDLVVGLAPGLGAVDFKTIAESGWFFWSIQMMKDCFKNIILLGKLEAVNLNEKRMERTVVM